MHSQFIVKGLFHTYSVVTEVSSKKNLGQNFRYLDYLCNSCLLVCFCFVFCGCWFSICLFHQLLKKLQPTPLFECKKQYFLVFFLFQCSISVHQRKVEDFQEVFCNRCGECCRHLMLASAFSFLIQLIQVFLHRATSQSSTENVQMTSTVTEEN